MIQVRRLGHVTYGTPDLKRQIEYYVQVVGLRVTSEEKNRVVLSTRLGDEAVIFETAREAGCRGLAFQVAPDVELADVAKAITAFGGKPERRSNVTEGIAESVVFQDPFGTKTELFATAKDFGFGPVNGIGPYKVGHVAYVVPDAKVQTDFYIKNLGFRISDWMEDFFSFLRCNPDHHAVNFITHEGEPKLHHLAFETRDWAHIEHTCDVLGQHHRKIIWGPIRHGIGHNIVVYHRDPDDNIVEFYAELDQMKDEALGFFDPRPWHESRPQRPRTWPADQAALLWGTPPTPDFLRGGTREKIAG
jgi:catechol 2,3-dioxygenase-like lactoylglutathione lyase family enzyme